MGKSSFSIPSVLNLGNSFPNWSDRMHTSIRKSKHFAHIIIAPENNEFPPKPNYLMRKKQVNPSNRKSFEKATKKRPLSVDPALIPINSPEFTWYACAIAELMTRDPIFDKWKTSMQLKKGKNFSKQENEKISQLERELYHKYPRVGAFGRVKTKEGHTLQFRISTDSTSFHALNIANNFTDHAGCSLNPLDGLFNYQQSVIETFVAKSTPQLLFSVDLTRISLWDLAKLSMEFKKVLRHYLKNRPPLSDETTTDPPELIFLRTVRPELFERDLRRFDLHFLCALSYRLIAQLEGSDEALAANTAHRQRVVGQKIPAESSVASSVQRIYRAINRKEYKAKRRRLDSPAEGILLYACPSHGNDCSSDCPYLKEWKFRVFPTLPSDSTGQSFLTSPFPNPSDF